MYAMDYGILASQLRSRLSSRRVGYSAFALIANLFFQCYHTR